MTMSPEDFSLDELAGAYLDDEVTPEERATAESDPAVVARVAEFRALRGALAADAAPGAPAGAAGTDEMITRALALYDELRGDSGGPVSSADGTPSRAPTPIVRLADRPRRIAAPWAWVAAAAAVAGGLFVVGRAIGVRDESSISASDGPAAEATTDAAAFEQSAGAAPAMTEAATASSVAASAAIPAAAPVATIGSIDGGAAVATAGPLEAPAATEAPAAAAATATDAATATTVVSFTAEEQLTLYVTSLAGGPAAERNKLVVPPANCQLSGTPVEEVSWRGTTGVLYLIPDATNPASAQIVGANCIVLVAVVVGP